MAGPPVHTRIWGCGPLRSETVHIGLRQFDSPPARAHSRTVRRGPIPIVLVVMVVLAGCTSSATKSTTATRGATHSTATTGSTTTTVAKSNWSSPVSVAHGTSLSTVDCPTTTFCLAVDDHGNVFRFNGATWSTAGTTGIATAGASSLSCAGPSFCTVLAEGADQVAIWNGSAFGTPTTLPAQSLDAVGCATPSFCVAIDGVGDGYYFDGSSWSNRANDWGSVASISCPSVTFCVSVGVGISTWDGQAWTQPQPFGLVSDNLTGVSCPSVTFCQVVDASGEVETWNGSTWAGPGQVPKPTGAGSGGVDLSDVSCPTTVFCAAVGTAGLAAAWSGADWASQTVDPGPSLTSVSCAMATFCVAVDQEGRALVYQ
jgi:uncharacterized protein YceK